MSTQIEVVTAHDAFSALAPAWNALWQRARGSYAQTHSFCWHSLMETAAPLDPSLYCVTVRDAGRLMLVWPLLKYAQRLWTALRPLGPDASEFSDMLVEAGSGAQALVDAAWQHVVDHAGADLLYLTNVPGAARLHWHAAHTRWLIRADTDQAPLALLSRHHGMGWETYHRGLGNHEPGRFASREKRLRALGEVGVRLVEPGDPACGPLIRQLLDWKRHWALHRGVESAWIFSPRHENFLVALAADASSAQPYYVMSVTLNGAPIASTLLGIAPGRVDAITGSFDPAYTHYSPGTIMKAKYVRWAFEQALDLEFGVGTEPFKLYWSGHNCRPVTSFQLALTSWGRIGILARDTAHTVRKFTPRARAVSGAVSRVMSRSSPV